MSKALSVDLRVRVLAAVSAGATHREAAERFGVSAASVSGGEICNFARATCDPALLAEIEIPERQRPMARRSWHGWLSTAMELCSSCATRFLPRASRSASRLCTDSLSGTGRLVKKDWPRGRAKPSRYPGTA